MVIGRKKRLFAGSEKGGERIANILTIIDTAKMNGHNPETYLTGVLTLIQDYGQAGSRNSCPGGCRSLKP